MTTRSAARSGRRAKGVRGFTRAAVLAFALAYGATAAAGVVRLEDLELRALDRRAIVSAARARTAAAQANVDVGRKAYLPSVVLNIGGSVSPGGQLIEIRDSGGQEFLVQGSRPLSQPGTFLPVGRYNALVSLKGPLYDFGRTGSAVAAAEVRGAAVRANQEVARADVVAEVRAAYLDWLGGTVLHTLAERRLADARQRVELVRARIESGGRPPSDLPLATYEETAAALEESASRGQVDVAKLELSRATATSLSADAEPDPSLFDRVLPDGGPATTPEMLALERRRDAALAAALAEEHTNNAIIGAVLDAGVRGQDQHVFPYYQLGVSIAVPLWDGDIAGTRAEISREEAAAVGAEVRERRATLLTQYERARRDGANANERLRIAERLRTIAQARARDARDRYDLGEGKLEPVLDAQAEEVSAEREVVLAKIARTDAAFRLERCSSAKALGPRRKP